MTSPNPTSVNLGDVLVGNGASTSTELGWQNVTAGGAGTQLIGNGTAAYPTFSLAIIRQTTILNDVPGVVVDVFKKFLDGHGHSLGRSN